MFLAMQSEAYFPQAIVYSYNFTNEVRNCSYVLSNLEQCAQKYGKIPKV